MANTENTANTETEGRMTRAEAMAYLNVSDRTLTNYVKEFELEATYERGVTRKVPLYKASDIERIRQIKSNPANKAVRGFVVDTENAANAATASTANTAIQDKANTAPSGNAAFGDAVLALSSPQMPHLDEQGGVAAFAALLTESYSQALREAANDDPTRLRAKATLTFPEAHIVTGVPERQLREAAKAGLIKEVKIGRANRVKTSEVIAFAESLFD
jgi:hypothetical protein